MLFVILTLFFFTLLPYTQVLQYISLISTLILEGNFKKGGKKSNHGMIELEKLQKYKHP